MPPLWLWTTSDIPSAKARDAWNASATGKGFHAPLFPGVVVDYIQFQPGFAAVVLRSLLLDQFKPAFRHLVQPAIGTGNDLAKNVPWT